MTKVKSGNNLATGGDISPDFSAGPANGMGGVPADGPEEVSVVLNRGSRVIKEFDILRFSKASSID